MGRHAPGAEEGGAGDSGLRPAEDHAGVVVCLLRDEPETAATPCRLARGKLARSPVGPAAPGRAVGRVASGAGAGGVVAAVSLRRGRVEGTEGIWLLAHRRRGEWLVAPALPG